MAAPRQGCGYNESTSLHLWMERYEQVVHEKAILGARLLTGNLTKLEKIPDNNPLTVLEPFALIRERIIQDAT